MATTSLNERADGAAMVEGLQEAWAVTCRSERAVVCQPQARCTHMMSRRKRPWPMGDRRASAPEASPRAENPSRLQPAPVLR